MVGSEARPCGSCALGWHMPASRMHGKWMGVLLLLPLLPLAKMEAGDLGDKFRGYNPRGKRSQCTKRTTPVAGSSNPSPPVRELDLSPPTCWRHRP
jgi:hypothetical protein